ncbi:hypothetical protein SF285071_3099 [Shigella flexneri 2850-71]|nr:hypothetical protein SF285071_3099 [Shigella flexneri 2850-71]
MALLFISSFIVMSSHIENSAIKTQPKLGRCVGNLSVVM